MDKSILACQRGSMQRHESWLRRKSARTQRIIHRSSQSDTAVRQKPSNIDVKHKAGTHLPTEIVYEESPVGDGNASGSIERANQTIQGQIRAIKDFTERQCDDEPRQLSLEKACTTCSKDIDDVDSERTSAPEANPSNSRSPLSVSKSCSSHTRLLDHSRNSL